MLVYTILTALLTSLLSAAKQLLHFRIKLLSFVLTSVLNCMFSVGSLFQCVGETHSNLNLACFLYFVNVLL